MKDTGFPFPLLKEEFTSRAERPTLCSEPEYSIRRPCVRCLGEKELGYIDFSDLMSRGWVQAGALNFILSKTFTGHS